MVTSTANALVVRGLRKAYGDVVAVDGLDLEGASLTSVGGEMLVIAGWLVVSFIAALKLFRWR